MASNRKWTAPEADDSRNTRKSRFLWFFKSTTKEAPLAPPGARVPTMELPGGSVMDSPEWNTMSIPERIDAIAAENRERDFAISFLQNDQRKAKLDLRLDITPSDPEWKKWFKIFQNELLTNTVNDVLEKCFEEGQKFAINPPIKDGIIVDMQEENAKSYKALIAGQLAGVKDNTITKLTMLHFGLPVEALSRNNVINAGRDEDDLPDAPEPIPMVQRIVQTDKPLEFLDSYHERSYGFPTLRRPKIKFPLQSQVVVDIEDLAPAKEGPFNDLSLFAHHRAHHGRRDRLNHFDHDACHDRPKPIIPPGTSVRLRGGAGESVIVYGPGGFGLQIEDSANAFLEAAFQILGISSSATTWSFVVDHYRDQEAQKNIADKPWVRSYIVDQSNFTETYSRYLENRLHNPQRDWLLVVRLTSDPKPLTYKLPKSLKKSFRLTGGISHPTTGNLADPVSPLKLSSSKSQSSKKIALASPNKVSAKSWQPTVEDEYSSFEEGLVKTTSGQNLPSHPASAMTKSASPMKMTRAQTNLPSKPAAWKKGWIYGFAGRFLVDLHIADIQEAALCLLRLNSKQRWEFCVRLGDSVKSHTITVDSRNFSQKFQQKISPFILAGNSAEWFLFVSISEWTGPVQPPYSVMDKRNVLTIVHGSTTAYWKIPKKMSIDYGLNQLQADFSRAMSLFFPSTALRPQENVTIGGVDIGAGGMEVTKRLWETVRRDIEQGARPDGSLFDYRLGFINNQREFSLESLAIRLAGSPNYAGAKVSDYGKIYEEILAMRYWLKNQEHPPQFRLWKTAHARETGGKSVLISYKPAQAAAQEIKRFLEEEPGSTNCIWFRPEWPSITIKDLGTEGKNSIVWDTDENHRTKKDFIDVLQRLFKDSNPDRLKNFEITDSENSNRFILSESTTEENWRNHIYDWFSTDEIYVKPIRKIVYEVEQTPPWGLLEPAQHSGKPNSQTGPQEPHQDHHANHDHPDKPHRAHRGHHDHHNHPDRNISRPDPPHHDHRNHPDHIRPRPSPKNASRQLNFGTNFGARPAIAPRINRERYLKDRVAYPPEQRWDNWSKNNHRLDLLQQKSYWKDTSVIEPGQKPEDPQYGHYTELSLTVGPHLPTLYLYGTTPSDYAKLAAENQFLRNSCLERSSKCVICDAAFPEYKPDEVRAHYRAHQEKENSAGTCPYCAESWAALDTEQRKLHLETHQVVTAKINHWQGTSCPECRQKFDSMDQEDIIIHFMTHARQTNQKDISSGSRHIAELATLRKDAKANHGQCPFKTSKSQNCKEDVSSLSRQALVEHFKAHASTASRTLGTGAVSFKYPVNQPDATVCNREFSPNSAQLQGHLRSHVERVEKPSNASEGNTSGTAVGDLQLALSPKKPLSTLSKKTAKSGPKCTKDPSYKNRPESESEESLPAESENAALVVAGSPGHVKRSRKPASATDPSYHDKPACDSDNDEEPESTGFAPRGRKRKAHFTASLRKVLGGPPAGSKTKAAANNTDKASEHPGFLFPKRQKIMRDESAGFTSATSRRLIDSDTSGRHVGVRRSTRATSGAPGPDGASMPKARTVARPPRTKTMTDDGLEEEDEAEMRMMISPRKRGRPSPMKKSAK